MFDSLTSIWHNILFWRLLWELKKTNGKVIMTCVNFAPRTEVYHNNIILLHDWLGKTTLSSRYAENQWDNFTARKESLFFNIYILVITKPYLWNRNWKSVVNKWEFWHVQHQNYSSRGLPKQNHGKNKCFLLINLYRHAYCACYITKFIVAEFHAHIFANRNITYILEVKVLVKVVFLNS